MIHRIYTGTEDQAEQLAGLFADDGCKVQYGRPLDRDFVLLEIHRTDAFLDAHLER